MTKFSVTQNGHPLDPSKYTWDGVTKTFSSKENNLVLDFSGVNGVTFKTGSDCTFKTGYSCTFDTGDYCTFKTRFDCTFNTGDYCTFDTGSNCTFDTGDYCTFNTGSNCTFDTGYNCTFDTESNCTFNTGKQCVVIRRDIFEVIQLVENQTIKLNEYQVPGFTVVAPKHKIVIDGKEIELSEESYQSLKKSLT